MMRLSELFEVCYGHSLELNRLKQSGSEGIPFVSRKMRDNGISAYVFPIPDLEPYPAGTLTCALTGNGVLSTFIQERPFYTGYHIACLTPKQDLSTAELLYYCMCIKANRYRYNYGRQANRTIRDILLPCLKEIPLWVKDTEIERFTSADKPIQIVETPALKTHRWKSFELYQLFDIQKGKRLTKANMTSGTTPFIGAVAHNNGYVRSIGKPAIHPGNTITVIYNGNGVAEAFYQAEPYWCSDDVNVLYPKFDLTPSIALFIAALLRLEKYRFNYGRKWHVERMMNSCIYLPIQDNSTPDWNFMEIYVASLPFSSQI